MMQPVNKSIHGHEVIDMMTRSGKRYSRENLKAEIIGKFGEETRFHTCSAENLDAGQLIEFLEQRGKFVGTESDFVFDDEKRCDHA